MPHQQSSSAHNLKHRVGMNPVADAVNDKEMAQLDDDKQSKEKDDDDSSTDVDMLPPEDNDNVIGFGIKGEDVSQVVKGAFDITGVAAADLRPYVGKKAYGFVTTISKLLKHYYNNIQNHREQAPTVSWRIKLNKRHTLNSDCVLKRYDMKLFLIIQSSKEQFKDTYF